MISRTLTQDELRALSGDGAEGGAIDMLELEQIAAWAERARLGADLLRLVLAGELTVRISASGEPVFRPTRCAR